MDKKSDKDPVKRRTLTEKEAAIYIGFSTATLRQGRMNGPRESRMTTPPYLKLGRTIRYLKEDLDQWLEEHRVNLVHPKRR